MAMMHVRDIQTVREVEFDSALAMKVGVGAVDPRLIEPDHREPDTEELIAYWTSCI
jgi:hypothetical protein